MKTKIEKAMNKAAHFKPEELDYQVLRECWQDVLSNAEEKYGFVDDSDHLMRYSDALRRGGFNSSQVQQLIKIFIESQK